MLLSKLQLALIHRIGGTFTSGSWQDRWTYDFLIDGKSLAGLFGSSKRDLVGRLDRDLLEWNAQSVRILTGDAPADFRDDRIMLYVCPECADLGCGAVTAALKTDEKTVTWSDFKHENNYDSSMTITFDEIGPFVFDAREYRRVLRESTRK
jgi:hypothetical protein